jgi:hypothetical protein
MRHEGGPGAGEIWKRFQRPDYAPWGPRIQHFPDRNWRW